MSFSERFKGRTSLINKEGITGVVKSGALPIVKTESHFKLPKMKNDPSELSSGNGGFCFNIF